jgi:hypothetical protein
MTVLNLIARLPNELKYCIFNYIDIDSRIELMTYVYNKRLFLEYIDAIPTEKNVQLFDKFITNKILTYKQRTANSYKSWYIKSSVSKLFPVLKYKIDNREVLSRNRIYDVLTRIANTEYIPRRRDNYTPHNLEWKRQRFIEERACDMYNVFSSFECDASHEKLKYFLKKVLLHYIIIIIINGKERALEKITQKKHAEIKVWLKRSLPKPLKHAATLYQRRAKLREKERLKIAKQNAKANAKRLKQKMKEEEKIRKKEEKNSKPKVVIIRRKRILNS